MTNADLPPKSTRPPHVNRDLLALAALDYDEPGMAAGLAVFEVIEALAKHPRGTAKVIRSARFGELWVRGAALHVDAIVERARTLKRQGVAAPGAALQAVNPLPCPSKGLAWARSTGCLRNGRIVDEVVTPDDIDDFDEDAADGRSHLYWNSRGSDAAQAANEIRIRTELDGDIPF